MKTARPILLGLFGLCALAVTVAVAQPVSPPLEVEITQVEIREFPRVTVFFKLNGPDGARRPVVRPEQIQVLEDDHVVDTIEFKGFGEFETTTLLLVDTSSSMSESAGAQAKIAAAKEACQSFLAVCRRDDHVGLISFNSQTKTLSPIGATPDDIRGQVTAMQPDGMTALFDGLHSALSALSQHQGRRTLLLLSDGVNTVNGPKTFDDAVKLAEQLQVPIYSVGLGDAQNIDVGKLQQLAEQTGGRFLHMPTTEHLAELYRSVGESAQNELSVTFRSLRDSPDGTRRRIRIRIVTSAGTIGGDADVLEPHLLNVRSHWGVFALFLTLLGLAYQWPLTCDRRRAKRTQQAQESAFAVSTVDRNAPRPEFKITTHLHPTALPVESQERVVTVCLEASAHVPHRAVLRCQPLGVLVLLDLSASMAGERLTAAKQALNSLIAGLHDEDSFGLIGFSSEPQLIIAPSKVGLLRAEFEQSLNGLRTQALTKLAPALELLRTQLPPPASFETHKLCVLVVSDGKLDDRATAIEARGRIPSAVSFSAFGIGVDYDCELLAQLCGGKDRVEHLLSAVEAAGEFTRFLRQFGHTVTSRTSLSWKLADGVRIGKITSERTASDLIPLGSETRIDDLALGEPTTLFVEFHLMPSYAGRRTLADLTLSADLPGYGVSDFTASHRLEIEVTADLSRVTSSPQVVSGLRKVQTARLVTVVEEDVKAGRVEEARVAIKRQTGILRRQGEETAAAVLEQLGQELEHETDPNKMVIHLQRRGNTRRLNEGL